MIKCSSCKISEYALILGCKVYHVMAQCPSKFIHSVRQLQQPPVQQYFPLTPLQHQLTTTSQPTVFFSHTTPATSSSPATAASAIEPLLVFRILTPPTSGQPINICLPHDNSKNRQSLVSSRSNQSIWNKWFLVSQTEG